MRQDQVAAWSRLYPAVDVERELEKACQRILDGACRKPTARGMPRFLHSWLARAQDAQPSRRSAAEMHARVGASSGQVRHQQTPKPSPPVQPDPETKEAWGRLLQCAQTLVSGESYRTWIVPIQAVKKRGSVLYIRAPNPLAEQYLRENFGCMLQDAATAVGLELRWIGGLDEDTGSVGTGGEDPDGAVELRPDVGKTLPALPSQQAPGAG